VLKELGETDRESIIQRQIEREYNEIHRFTFSESPKIVREIQTEYNKNNNKKKKTNGDRV